MKGDFARFTFDLARHYNRVLQQQGRVLLDADWNEPGSIQLHLLRALAINLAGPAWAAGDGFSVLPQGVATLPEKPGDWPLSAGHFYVDGMLGENNRDHTTLSSQPYAPTPDDSADRATAGSDIRQTPSVLWLDVWERHVSAAEATGITDVARDGADTVARGQPVWQLRLFDPVRAGKWLGDTLTALHTRRLAVCIGDDTTVLDWQIADAENLCVALAQMSNPSDSRPEGDPALVGRVLDARASLAVPFLRAALVRDTTGTAPNVMAADAGYRGLENRLYRIEIHRGGLAVQREAQGATFKWSRDNGSIVFPVIGCSTPTADSRMLVTVALAPPGREEWPDLAVGDWVELLDDDCTLAQRDTFPLLQIVALAAGASDSRVTLRVPDGRVPHLPDMDPQRHPLLRRWDQRGSTDAADVLNVVEGDPIPLEAGINVTFETGGHYAHGDYWTVAARAAGSGMLDWPQEIGTDGQPELDDCGQPVAAAVPAAGRHHYAVLGRVDASGGYHEYCRRIDARRL